MCLDFEEDNYEAECCENTSRGYLTTGEGTYIEMNIHGEKIKASVWQCITCYKNYIDATTLNEDLAEEVFFMNEHLKSQIKLYCQMIKTGKPSALLPIQDRYVKEAIKITIEEDLEVYIEKLSEGWKSLWIFKDDYLLDVIKKMPEQPKTAYDHWVLGKIFGYSDDSIKKFIETKLYGTQCDYT